MSLQCCEEPGHSGIGSRARQPLRCPGQPGDHSHAVHQGREGSREPAGLRGGVLHAAPVLLAVLAVQWRWQGAGMPSPAAGKQRVLGCDVHPGEALPRPGCAACALVSEIV